MSDQIKKEEDKTEEELKLEEEKKRMEETINSLTAEIQDVRKSRKEDREALDALLKSKEDNAPTDPADPADPTDTVKKLLQEQENANIERYKTAALDEFKRSNPEFHPDNDKTGLGYAAFEKELAKFNLSNLRDKEEFSSMYKEVLAFMKRKEKLENYNGSNSMAGTPSNSGGDAFKTSDGIILSDQEKRLIEQQGWDKERYIKLKEKRPSYVNNLLRYSS